MSAPTTATTRRGAARALLDGHLGGVLGVHPGILARRPGHEFVAGEGHP